MWMPLAMTRGKQRLLLIYCCFFWQLLIYGYVRISQNTPCNIQYPDLVRSRALRMQRHHERNKYEGTEENHRASRKIK
ncbi:uncharacterized protein BO80DRAFT_183972 [Aspergillus ibericus CBS 121593]|uniref:Uncharacterized protein n=1 Tax=Aspergillus ibericus CBS 121593 TaxID=1448316 RepID=A0A395GRV9_9EURO|nr:hypothetical protein BO80DRAFT_183972 [Aspergillus ibericus CBS 121593]RAK97698.1 hypothetical protein BO80DRAFT_183972 [Aspergillus ibericus CBS 121593]